MPDWIEQSRRLGGLLIGVASQAGRPISLAKEWEPIARHLLREHEQDLLMLQSSSSSSQIKTKGKGEEAFEGKMSPSYNPAGLSGGRVPLQKEEEIPVAGAASGGKLLAP